MGTDTTSVAHRDGEPADLVQPTNLAERRGEPVHALDCDLDEDCSCGAAEPADLGRARIRGHRSPAEGTRALHPSQAIGRLAHEPGASHELDERASSTA